MSIYAIGDVQGCYDELRRLVELVRFDPASDRLWFVGDLVNRGPRSLDVVRFVRGLGEAAVTVLGNHDLHLVCHYEGFQRLRPGDTFQDLLRAADARELVAWLRTRPMMHAAGGWAMVHAGLLPQWTIEEALALAREVEEALAGPRYRQFLANLYGSEPDSWRDTLAGWDRLRVIVNAMTRMRFCTPAGRMEFHAKGTRAPPGFEPWYAFRRDDDRRLIAGHWSALGLKLEPRAALLDSGCVWGGSLSALRLEDRSLHQIGCREYRQPGDEA